MELITTDDFFILQNVEKGETNLWCCRYTGKFQLRPSWDLAGQENPECLGIVWGLYGKLSIHPELPERLVLVRHCERVGELPGRNAEKHSVYKVTNVVLVPIVPRDPSQLLYQQLRLKPCFKHHAGDIQQPNFEPTTSESQGKSTFAKIPKFGGSLKTLAQDTIKNTAGNVATAFSSQIIPWKYTKSVSKTLERYEKRIVEELAKLFNDSHSFYFSPSGDVTSSLRRLVGQKPTRSWLSNVDDRFFFNKSMVQELIDTADTRAHGWITPFIQGYIEMRECSLDGGDDHFRRFQDKNPLPRFYSIAIVSRRSRHRAGTRYKRRGVDEEGHVANYVETEQILQYHHYALSFLQVRGSVPVFWSQPGIKYRPPPRLDRSLEEDRLAFARHFDAELAIYGPPVHCVNLAEKLGREKVISDAYFDQALCYNNPNLTFVSFDFHDACRGMHFENVSLLTDAVENALLKDVRYTWLDKHGMVCRQNGVFRINCIDCLDRTNVVQTAIAKLVLENQLIKLGVTLPEKSLPDETRKVFQLLWANNGDALSRQYAGTNALKGDFTRTGERKLSGLMKDGMYSASRYYLNQFRDAYRQVAIDLITGQIVSECLVGSNADDLGQYDDDDDDDDDEAGALKAEQVKAVVDDCKRLLIPDPQSVIGTWGLVDADPITGDPSQEDLDIIFILTRDLYYFVNYDDDVDKVTCYQRVALQDVESIEVGGVEESPFQFKLRKSMPKSEAYLRISYRMPGPPSVVYNDSTGNAVIGPPPHGAKVSGYFHMVRSANMRFFNNLAFAIKTEEERLENLRSVADSLVMAMELQGIASPKITSGKLERRRSKIPDTHSNFNEMVCSSSSARGGRASSAVKVFKGASSKALSSVTSQFSKLNPLLKLKQPEAAVVPPSISVENADADAADVEGDRSSCSDPLSENVRSLAARDQIGSPTIRRQDSPNLLDDSSIGRLTLSRKFSSISKSSEDVGFNRGRMGGSDRQMAAAASRMYGGSSLQKDLNVITQGLDGVALDSAAVVKEVLHPFAKLTKGIQSVVLKKKTKTEDDSSLAASLPEQLVDGMSCSAASNQTMDYMTAKLAETSSLTKVFLL